MKFGTVSSNLYLPAGSLVRKDKMTNTAGPGTKRGVSHSSYLCIIRVLRGKFDGYKLDIDVGEELEVKRRCARQLTTWCAGRNQVL
jgi:hypothetical protein